jgi:hypothetical protein
MNGYLLMKIIIKKIYIYIYMVKYSKKRSGRKKRYSKRRYSKRRYSKKRYSKRRTQKGGMMKKLKSGKEPKGFNLPEELKTEYNMSKVDFDHHLHCWRPYRVSAAFDIIHRVDAAMDEKKDTPEEEYRQLIQDLQTIRRDPASYWNKWSCYINMPPSQRQQMVWPTFDYFERVKINKGLILAEAAEGGGAWVTRAESHLLNDRMEYLESMIGSKQFLIGIIFLPLEDITAPDRVGRKDLMDKGLADKRVVTTTPVICIIDPNRPLSILYKIPLLHIIRSSCCDEIGVSKKDRVMRKKNYQILLEGEMWGHLSIISEDQDKLNRWHKKMQEIFWIFHDRISGLSAAAEKAAATEIQKRYRGNKSRSEAFPEDVQERERMMIDRWGKSETAAAAAAATEIQKRYRGNKSRLKPFPLDAVYRRSAADSPKISMTENSAYKFDDETGEGVFDLDEEGLAEPLVMTLDDMPEGLTTLDQMKWKKVNGLSISKYKGHARVKPRRAGMFLEGSPEPPPGLTKIELIKWKNEQKRHNQLKLEKERLDRRRQKAEAHRHRQQVTDSEAGPVETETGAETFATTEFLEDDPDEGQTFDDV